MALRIDPTTGHPYSLAEMAVYRHLRWLGELPLDLDNREARTGLMCEEMVDFIRAETNRRYAEKLPPFDEFVFTAGRVIRIPKNA